MKEVLDFVSAVTDIGQEKKVLHKMKDIKAALTKQHKIVFGKGCCKVIDPYDFATPPLFHTHKFSLNRPIMGSWLDFWRTLIRLSHFLFLYAISRISKRWFALYLY